MYNVHVCTIHEPIIIYEITWYFQAIGYTKSQTDCLFYEIKSKTVKKKLKKK